MKSLILMKILITQEMNKLKKELLVQLDLRYQDNQMKHQGKIKTKQWFFNKIYWLKDKILWNQSNLRLVDIQLRGKLILMILRPLLLKARKAQFQRWSRTLKKLEYHKTKNWGNSALAQLNQRLFVNLFLFRSKKMMKKESQV
jgi:hypothetical protein